MTGNRWLAVAVVCALAGPAGAGPAPRTGRTAAIASLSAALSGANAEDAVKAATALGAAREPAAHEALLDALALGLPAPVAPAAFAALGQHPAPPDVVALVRYAHHRNPTVRAAAIAALVAYLDPAARAAVIEGLHDPIASVRGAAAAAAAKGRVRDALDPLFALLGRGELPAAQALAQLADPELARKIGDQLGQVPDPALAACLGAILERADFGPDTARVEVVRALGKMTDPAAVDALTDYVDHTPKNPPRPSRDEAEKLVEARVGGGK